MKKYILLALSLLLISVPVVMAGTGSLRISPYWPTMVDTPAEFTVWCQSGISYDVEILLVMTEECYASFPDTGAVVITQGVTTLATFDKADFAMLTGMGGVYVPPSGATNGARYQVSALKDHLDLGMPEPLESDDAIYWSMAPIFDQLDDTMQDITVTLNSDSPRMLVYIMGKSVDGAELLDMAIPPTPAGFVIPEIPLGTIGALSAAIIAVAVIAKKRTIKQ